MSASLIGFKRVKVVALAVSDPARAEKFYGATLGLKPATEGGTKFGYEIGDCIIMLKAAADWYGKPTGEPNPRITVEVNDAKAAESALRERGVTITDAVQEYDEGHSAGSFLDSEGNKIWFCS